MKTKQLTCKERIDMELESRIKDFEDVLNQIENSKDGAFIIDDYKYGDFIEWINDYALAFDDDLHYNAKRLELSYGGPQDYFLFFEDGTITYHFLDWFDGAKKELYGHNLSIMEQIRDWLDF